VRLHPEGAEVLTVDPKSGAAVEALGARLERERFDWVISLDDEEPLCRLASRVPAERRSGAHLDPATEARAYSEDSAPWFDMGLLSVHGKDEADRLKAANVRSHPEILCTMLGLAVGEPLLPADPQSEAAVAARLERLELGDGPLVGLNTGAGGRWRSKALPEERVAELVRELDRRIPGQPSFLVLGGPDEAERNARILAELSGPEAPRVVDAGADNELLEFSALVARCALLVTSDSLALHVAIGRRVPVVAFFAPTSAAEIELYGRGEKVVSTAPDACSYRPDADTSTLTVERLARAVLRQLGRLGQHGGDAGAGGA
jgi:heptosyltransferase-2